MELTTVWFSLIAILWIGYFVLEGFDFGVGMLLPILASNDRERRVLINTIGPVWDGNEVWLLVAGGATFAAFPEWYATLFSGFYLPLLLILLTLIVRGLAFEYRAKGDTDRWRSRWDAAIIVGSYVPAAAVGRGLRQHPPRGADRRAGRVRRRVLQPAQPLRPARRRDDAAAVPHPRRHVRLAEDRRGDPPPGPCPGGPDRGRSGGRGRRLPRLDPGGHRQPGLGAAVPRRRRRAGGRAVRGRQRPARAGASWAPSWRSCSGSPASSWRCSRTSCRPPWPMAST